MIIDFFTRRRIDKDAPAKCEIIDWHDDEPMVLIDGLVPRELAVRFVAECEKFNQEASR